MSIRLHFIPVGRNKVPLTPNGEKDATTSRHWSHLPNANPALCTGPSRLIAVDEDTYKMVYVPRSLEREIGEDLPPTATWRTGRGGMVRLFSCEGELPTSRNGVLPGVDVKAKTGYVLYPGSKNEAGQTYTWVSNIPPAPAPKSLITWLNSLDPSKRALPRRTVGSREEVFLNSGTGRWDAVRHLGGLLRRKGVGEVALVEMLSSFVRHHCEPDDTVRESELVRMARWLASNPPEDPFRNDTAAVMMPDGTTEEMEAVAEPIESDADDVRIVKNGFGSYSSVEADE